MRFRCVSEVREDHAGAIECVEVRWNEPRAYVTEMWLGTISMFMMLMALVSCAWLMWPGLNLYDPFLMWSGLIVAWGCVSAASFFWTFSVEMKGCPRILAFTCDGIMRAPLGLATGRLSQDRSHLAHSDIVAVEAREEPGTTTFGSDPNTWAIDFQYRTGHVVTVAERLSEENAARLKVTLTSALNDLRSVAALTVGAADGVA